jgi:HK97 family phage prohead protease
MSTENHPPAERATAPAVEQRIDTEDLSTIAQMIQLGACFIDDQDEVGDAAASAAMEVIVADLADLIPGELDEDEPVEPDDEPAGDGSYLEPMPMAATRNRGDIERALERCDVDRMSERIKRRVPLVDIALRNTPTTTGDGSYVIQGHAAVVNQETVLYDNGWMRVRERIAPGAFDRVLAGNPDVHLNINHDMHYAMARTGRGPDQVGGMSLAMDDVGLATTARVSGKLTFARDLAEQMSTGVIDQMSFAFTIADERRTEVDNGDTIDVLYEIREVGQLFDVCVCAQGAYPQTDSSIRSLDAAMRRDAGDRDRPSREAKGPETIDDASVSGGQASTRLQLARAKARAAASRFHYATKETQ